MAGAERSSGRWPTGGERWTGGSDHKPKLGLFRGQARRHGMKTSDWGREPDRESVPRFKDISSAMSPGTQGKSKSGHGFKFSNMQPRRK